MRQCSLTILSVFINELLLVQSLFISPQSIHYQNCQRINHHYHHINQRLHHRRIVAPITYSSNKRRSSRAAATPGALNPSAHGCENDGDTRSSSGLFTQSAEDVYSVLVELARQSAVSRDKDSTLTRTDDLLLGIEDIKRGWVELGDLIVDDELSSSELEFLYNKCQESSSGDKIDKKGFIFLYQSIDDLFEPGDEGDDGDDTLSNGSKAMNTGIVYSDPQEEQSPSNDNVPTITSSTVLKEKLLSILAEVRSNDNISARVFDYTDEERDVIHHLIGLMEMNGPSEAVLSKRGKIDESNLMGEWDLRYTSSHAMLINRSLSGLGRSTSTKAQFQGLRKRLGGTKYLGKAEYIETFGGEEASFDVVVTGEWFLEERKNASRKPLSLLRVNPEKLTYGLITNEASEWSSLGPIKLLDILYLDEDLMILRGHVNLKSFFIYQRNKE